MKENTTQLNEYHLLHSLRWRGESIHQQRRYGRWADTLSDADCLEYEKQAELELGKD
jgi:hypothetical protein